MSWSFRFARLFGVDVKIHYTFLLLLLMQWVGGYSAGGMEAAALRTALTVAIFGCVVLHEFGHIFTARRFGIQTRDVILLPIGGVARIERLPETPREEFLIAIAGPLVNVVIAALLYLALRATGQALQDLVEPHSARDLFNDLLIANLFLFGFNLVPAYPMDGGRILRALLNARLGLLRATRLAAKIGQGLAMFAGLYGLLRGDPMLLLVALFVFFGAGAEAAAVETREAGRGIVVDQMMVTRFVPIPVHARLREAVDLLLAGEQREFPVVDNLGRVEGVLTRENLIKGLSERGPDATVGEAMTSPVQALQTGLSFEAALAQLRASGLPALPVLGPDGGLVGLLTMDNITELILVRRAVGPHG